MIDLQTLGALSLRRPDGAELHSVLAQGKRTALLVYLALARPHGFHRRDTLIGLFWPEHDAERARANLRQAVHFLRRSLGEGAIVSRGDDIGLADGVLNCDTVQFDAALDAGEVARGLNLYAGDLLPGFFVEEAPEFERWLEKERARLRDRAVRGCWALAETKEAAGDRGAAAEWGRRALGITPAEDTQIMRLMQLLARAGDRSGALAAFEAYARRLRTELELEPTEAAAALAAEIWRAQPAQPERDEHEAAPSPERGGTPEKVRARATGSGRAQPQPARTPMADPAAAAAPADIDTPAIPRGGPPAPTHAAAEPRPSARGRAMRRFAGAGVALLLLGAGLVAFLVRRSHPGPTAAAWAETASIAVLPFADLSPGRDQAYFADGITAELIELLGQIPGIRVPGPTSSFYFKGKSLPLKDIARQLRVANIMEGAVLKSGQHVRVTVRLTSAASDRQLWTHSYETPNADVSDVQHQIARYLASRLGVAAADFPARSPHNPEAYDLYFQGLFALRDATYEPGTVNLQEQKAIGLFRRVLDLDPRFAPAWAGLARAHYYAGDFASAEQEARRALALDSSLASARIALAGSLGYGQWKWTEAEQELEHGVRLTPSAALLYQARANLRGALGREMDASADFERAEQLDPSGAYLGAYAIYLANVGRWQRALHVLERIPGNDPAVLQPEYRMPPDLRFTRFKIYVANGLRAQAMAIVIPDIERLQPIILRGDPEEGLRYARRPGMVRAPPIWTSSFLCGVLLGARAPRTTAAGPAPSAAELHALVSAASELYYQHLEKEVRAHGRWAATDLRSWAADSLRSQPRFQRLMREVGLPD